MTLFSINRQGRTGMLCRLRPQQILKQGAACRRFHIKTPVWVLIFFFLSAGVPCIGWAHGPVSVRVRVIHAAAGPHHMDPGLKALAGELQSVFKYTSYRLLSHNTVSLSYHETGRISLPGARILEITPTTFQNNRVGFNIAILKQHAPVFNTRILLRNRSSITIGGPAYQRGYLLFNISAQAR